MTKATRAVLLKPLPFAAGLNVWSCGNGTAGSETYEGAPNAEYVAADQDFGGAFEVRKTEDTQRLRYMRQTPLSPGRYLRITARVKAVDGPLPSVRVAGEPFDENGSLVDDVPRFTASTTLTKVDEVVEISVIVGAQNRPGVDLVWGAAAAHGHFGIDLGGPNGGVVRIDDIEIEDVTSIVMGDRPDRVNVTDFGAIGDGVTDDTAAFEAANTAAEGRTLLVPAGTYRLDGSVTIDTHVDFEGIVTMPDTAVLMLRRDFDLPSYIAAFGQEELAFRKAFQALLTNADHDILDMGGRKIDLTRPIDMGAAVPDCVSYAERRVIRNGEFQATDSPAWDSDVLQTQATYSTADSRTLSNVADIADVPVGALVEGKGVGREVYVCAKNAASREITLSAPLFDAVGTQSFTFRRFKYLLDFSGFDLLSNFVLADIEFQCDARASGVMLAKSGQAFQLRDCLLARPGDRGASSPGSGCQGLLIDRCKFFSAEDALPMPQRKSIGFNANSNGVRLRNSRATGFRHVGVLGGAENIIANNHFFQDDEIDNGIRSGGLVLAEAHSTSIISGNCFDNCSIEWSNEHDSAPAFNSASFSALSITDNLFLSGAVAPGFSFIVVKPYGAGHFLSGVSVSGNKFRCRTAMIDRVERVNAALAALDLSRCKNVVFTQNSFHGVQFQVETPAKIEFVQNTASNVWTIDCAAYLPFGGNALVVESVLAQDALRDASNVRQWVTPFAEVAQGPLRNRVSLNWPMAVSGRVQITVRLDIR